MFLIENTHEGIISQETFDAVQAEFKRRHAIGTVNVSVGQVFRKIIYCEKCGRRFCHTSNGKGVNKHRAWICGGRDKRTRVNCTAKTIPEPTLMNAAAEALGINEFDGEVFTVKVERIIARDGRRLTFILKDGSETSVDWKRRKAVPYSTIGIEKRRGRNICYSIIGKGNGKVGERRRKKEAELNANRTSHSGEET